MVGGRFGLVICSTMCPPINYIFIALLSEVIPLREGLKKNWVWVVRCGNFIKKFLPTKRSEICKLYKKLKIAQKYRHRNSCKKLKRFGKSSQNLQKLT